jgi:hypothetical protein
LTSAYRDWREVPALRGRIIRLRDETTRLVMERDSARKTLRYEESRHRRTTQELARVRRDCELLDVKFKAALDRAGRGESVLTDPVVLR